jgi:hypothetical protein
MGVTRSFETMVDFIQLTTHIKFNAYDILFQEMYAILAFDACKIAT